MKLLISLRSLVAFDVYIKPISSTLRGNIFSMFYPLKLYLDAVKPQVNACTWKNSDQAGSVPSPVDMHSILVPLLGPTSFCLAGVVFGCFIGTMRVLAFLSHVI